MVPVDGDRRDRVPVHRRDRRLDPHRDGAPAVDRAGPAQDVRCALAQRQLGDGRDEHRRVRAALHRARGRGLRPDAPLRPARPAAPCARRARRRRRRWASRRQPMDLATFWFCLIAVLWSGYFLLEGFDFGVGMLLPYLPRDERERDTMFESIGPVWDGNEVWLVVAGGATFAAFPAWYATMFSGFYLALLLILVLLIVRVVSFEWRERSTARAGGRRGGGRTPWAASAPRSCGASRWPTSCTASRWTPTAISPATCSTSSAAYTVLAGLSVVALFALHGAIYLNLRTSGELCERAAVAARRLAVPAAIVVTAFLAWTVAVAIDRNDRDVFPTVAARRAGRRSRSSLAAALVHARRSGWAFMRLSGGRRGVGGDDLHGPVSARARLAPDLRQQPDDLRGRGGPLRAERHHRGGRRSARRSCCSTRAGPTTCSAHGWAAGARPPRPAARAGARAPAAPPRCRRRRRPRSRGA